MHISLEVLESIGLHCPRALYTYLQCLKGADKSNSVTFFRRDIVITLSMSYCRFKNDLKELTINGLVIYEEKDKTLKVTILGDRNCK